METCSIPHRSNERLPDRMRSCPPSCPLTVAEPITVYSQGTAHIVQAMHRGGVRRLVCVSSSATDPRHVPEGGLIFKKILQPFFIRVVGRSLHAHMQGMETLVMNSRLDWTIIRPSGLFVTPAVTDYHVAESHISGRFTSRADLADCMLQQLTADRYLRKVVAVATSSVQPNLSKLQWSEGISKALPSARRARVP